MEHATHREITAQPRAIEAIIQELQRHETQLQSILSPTSTFCLTGCGTSHYLPVSGNALLNDVASSTVLPAGEVLVSPSQLPTEGVDAILSVSRSGDTTETVHATAELQERYPNATSLALTCYEDSELADLTDIPIVSPEGAEESVVMTKSYSSLLVAFEYLARAIETSGIDDTEFASLPSQSEAVVAETEDLAQELGERTDLEKSVFLGTGEYFGLASEAMLKFEEMTLSWTKAYHPLEFRHGPQSIADEQTLVTVFLPDRRLDLHADLLADITDFGATTLAIGPESAIERVEATHTVELPEREPPSMALYAPAFQFLGYYRAVAAGLNPDEPQNLTQVVKI